MPNQTFLSLATFIIPSAVSASPMPQLSNHDIRQHLICQMLGVDVIWMQPTSPHRRKIEETDCPGTPFLWKIIEDKSGKHVGFGLGTMHLPAELILTEEAYASILSAVEGKKAKKYLCCWCLVLV